MTNYLKSVVCSTMLASILPLVTLAQPTNGMLGADGVRLIEDYFANPYVTEGLVCMWDGEWNAGLGVHDDNASVWKDCIGGLDLTRFSPVAQNAGWWTGNSYHSPLKATNTKGDYFNSKTITQEFADALSSSYITIEFCFKSYESYANNLGLIHCYQNGFSWVTDAYLTVGIINKGCQYAIRGEGWNTTTSRGVLPWQNGQFTTMSILGYGIGEEALAYNQAMQTWQSRTMVPVNEGAINPQNMILYVMGLAQNSNDTLQGDLYNIRIYNRPLTEEEMAWNHEVDCARFGGEQ